MRYDDLADFLRHVGKDPSTLIFEDDLTGIHNRRFLLSYLEHKVRWASGEDYPLSLLFLDLDGFKDVNDTHGHETGDQVLIWTAGLLSDVAGEDGLPVRYGGDEFVVLLPETDAAGGFVVAEKLRRDIAGGLDGDREALRARLIEECAVDELGAQQMIDYIRATRDGLGIGVIPEK